jgi:hypothetical protein
MRISVQAGRIPTRIWRKRGRKNLIMERRAFLLSSVMATLLAGIAKASPIDPKQTFVLQHDDIEFVPWRGLPPNSGEMAKLYGDFDQMGPYLVLMKWNPGWFSAPHGSGPDGPVGNLVGQPWCRLHTKDGGAGVCRRLRQANGAYISL